MSFLAFFFRCVCSLYVWTKFPRVAGQVPTRSKFPRITYIRKRMSSFIFMRLTRVVVLYISLRLVEGVYKPQGACVGWAGVTEPCLEACMWIKRTCLDEVPPRHPTDSLNSLGEASNLSFLIPATIHSSFQDLYPFQCAHHCFCIKGTSPRRFGRKTIFGMNIFTVLSTIFL